MGECECGCNNGSVLPKSFSGQLFLHARHIRRALAVFSAVRVFVAPMDFLNKGASFYNTIATFLGVREFPADHEWRWENKLHVGIYNSTEELRDLALSSAPDARAAHVQGMAAAQDFYAPERASLRELFSKLP